MIRSWCHLRRVEDEVAVKWEIVKLGVVSQVKVALKSFLKLFVFDNQLSEVGKFIITGIIHITLLKRSMTSGRPMKSSLSSSNLLTFLTVIGFKPFDHDDKKLRNLLCCPHEESDPQRHRLKSSLSNLAAEFGDQGSTILSCQLFASNVYSAFNDDIT